MLTLIAKLEARVTNPHSNIVTNPEKMLPHFFVKFFLCCYSNFQLTTIVIFFQFPTEIRIIDSTLRHPMLLQPRDEIIHSIVTFESFHPDIYPCWPFFHILLLGIFVIVVRNRILIIFLRKIGLFKKKFLFSLFYICNVHSMWYVVYHSF